MPSAPLKLCCQPGCNERTAERFCEKHRTENHSVETSRAYDKRRWKEDEFRPLYKTTRWMLLANLVFREQNRLCATCNIHACKDCDHIVPAKRYVAEHNGDMARFWDRSNLQGLCKACHTAKTRAGL